MSRATVIYLQVKIFIMKFTAHDSCVQCLSESSNIHFKTATHRLKQNSLDTRFTPLQAVDPQSALKNFKAPEKFCPFKKPLNCNPQFPYRTLDGSCNNLQNTWWGRSEAPFKRWLSADYSDRK